MRKFEVCETAIMDAERIGDHTTVVVAKLFRQNASGNDLRDSHDNVQYPA